MYPRKERHGSRTFRRALAWTMAGAMAAGSLSVCAEEGAADKALADGVVNAETASNYITDDFSNDMYDRNYTVVSQSQDSPCYQGEQVCIPAAENFQALNGTEIVPDEYGLRGGYWPCGEAGDP